METGIIIWRLGFNAAVHARMVAFLIMFIKQLNIDFGKLYEIQNFNFLFTFARLYQFIQQDLFLRGFIIQ